jgi:hypothetical protein
MSVFGKILEKLGLRKDQDQATTDPGAPNRGAARSQAPTQSTAQARAPGERSSTMPPPGRPASTSTGTTGQARTAPRPGSAPSTAARPAAMSDTDVEAKLDRLAQQNPQQLNWRTSIVDLMKLLDMDSSLAERKELAAELGYPRDDMDDSAKMNVWLHKQVLRQISQNGGNVPKELLD